MQKKIIVTGGLGFIGSNLIRFLIAKGFFVINIDKVSYSSNFYNLHDVNKKKYKFFRSNIGNQSLVKKILLRYRPIGIFNLAAETHVDRSIDGPRKFIENNICDVFNLLETVKIYQKEIKDKRFRFIHISTDEVYGDIKKKTKSKEGDSYLPSSPYAASKGASDLLIKSYIRTYEFPAIITNCCNNYGPRQYPEKLIPRIIINCKKNINLPVYGNGQNEREWIHVNDHCSALLKIFKKGKLGESYNIGSGNIIKNLDLIKKVIFYVKKFIQSNSQIEFVQDRPGHDKRYALDSKKIKTKLRWKKKYNFNNGIEDTVKWYLGNETWLSKLINKKYLKRIGLKL